MTVNRHLVIDGVAHAFDHRPENCRVRYAQMQNENNFEFQQASLPAPYAMTHGEYFRQTDVETMLSMFFRESQTDIVCYHSVPAWGVWADISPMSVGLEMRRRAPGRVFCYGAVSPGEGTAKAIAELERQAEEWGPIDGVKLYPFDFIDGVYQAFSLGDERLVFPILEKCVELGISTVAIHKAIPLAGMPMDPHRVGDVDYAAVAFPQLNFEIVHAGFAFAEETALQIGRFPNVYANFEATSALVVLQPRMFAQVLGQMLFLGGGGRIVWGTGAMAFHPQPLIEAFARFEMPPDLVADYGYPEITDEIRADVLGRNWARMHGLDADELASAIAGDAWDDPAIEQPWAALRGAGVTA